MLIAASSARCYAHRWCRYQTIRTGQVIPFRRGEKPSKILRFLFLQPPRKKSLHRIPAKLSLIPYISPSSHLRDFPLVLSNGIRKRSVSSLFHPLLKIDFFFKNASSFFFLSFGARVSEFDFLQLDLACRYRDEDGELLMDPDAVSDREPSPEPYIPDAIDDDEEDWQRDRSPTPVHDSARPDDSPPSKGKPRKRLVKKSGGGSGPRDSAPDLEDDGDFQNAAADVGEESEGEPASFSKKKRKERDGEMRKKEKRPRKENRSKSSASFSKGGSSMNQQSGDPEMKELWDTIAGGDSEDDREGVRTVDDNDFIDDTGVDPAHRYGSDNEVGSPGRAPQAEEGEEDDEIKELFQVGKKKKKSERSRGEINHLVEHVMAVLEVTAEEDAELNRQNKPAINKLKKLPLLTDVLSKKQLQQEFLDHGVLHTLKNWLEPLPDGSLPNMNVRTAILKILTDERTTEKEWPREGVAYLMEHVIMFLSRTDEETTANRKIAKDLVDKWSRPIFNKSTRFEDMRSYDDERLPYRLPTSKKPVTKAAGLESRDDDLDLGKSSQEPKSGQSSSRQHASRPEALPMDFLVRPQSKIDPDEIRARAKQVMQDQRRLKMNKKLQQLKGPKKKQLQATKLSVEGRGMVKATGGFEY
ncbi:hypothetical protein ACLOJK_029994 [Asimina triloba]